MLRVIAYLASAALGLGFLLYPQANAWNQERTFAATSAAFRAQSAAISPAATSDIIAAAREYNRHLTEQPAAAYPPEAAETDADYQAQLRINDTPLMGEVLIPAINVRLPLSHGTSEEALATGAGHVYGSSLPVGGPGTHAVISAHAEVNRAERFTNLDQLVIGDEFFIFAGGQMLRYQVDQIKVVLPDDLSDLQVVPDQDYVTLLTCTPKGINSHRLLVRGVRVPNVVAEPVMAGTPFPWWAVWYVGGLGAAGIYSGLLNRKRKPVAVDAVVATASLAADIPVVVEFTGAGQGESR